MFHLTQILVPLIVGGQQRHSDDSIGEGGLCEAANHPRVSLSLAFLPASGAVLPSACASWPKTVPAAALLRQRARVLRVLAQLQPGLALAGAVVLRLLVVEGLVGLGPGVDEGLSVPVLVRHLQIY